MMTCSACRDCPNNDGDVEGIYPDCEPCILKVIHWNTFVHDFVNPDPEKYMVVYVKGWQTGTEPTWYTHKEKGTHWLVEREGKRCSRNWLVHHIVFCDQEGNPYSSTHIGFRGYHIKKSHLYGIGGVHVPKIELPKELFTL